MMKKLHIYISALVVILMLGACAESEISILESAEELGFTGSQDDIRNFLTTNVYNTMNSLGLDINPGSTPPNVEGTFVAQPYCLVNSTVSGSQYNCDFAPFYITFSSQNNDDLTINYFSQQINSEGTVIFEESGSGFISGEEDGSFTVIVRATNSDGTENATAFSGLISFDGIFSYQDIFVPNISESELVGNLFIDDDGLAQRQ